VPSDRPARWAEAAVLLPLPEGNGPRQGVIVAKRIQVPPHSLTATASQLAGKAGEVTSLGHGLQAQLNEAATAAAVQPLQGALDEPRNRHACRAVWSGRVRSPGGQAGRLKGSGAAPAPSGGPDERRPACRPLALEVALAGDEGAYRGSAEVLLGQEPGGSALQDQLVQFLPVMGRYQDHTR
jgi:hypothetical protein